MNTTPDKPEQEEIRNLQYYVSHIRRDIANLFKWLILAVATGLIVGAVSSFFADSLKKVTSLRGIYPQIFLLLPVSGLLIVFLYQKIDKEDGGTNQVLSTIRSQDDVPFRSAPLIFISTILTHVTGGSAGREGAAIQLGGSIGNQLSRWLKLDEEDTHVMIMCDSEIGDTQLGIIFSDALQKPFYVFRTDHQLVLFVDSCNSKLHISANLLIG